MKLASARIEERRTAVLQKQKTRRITCQCDGSRIKGCGDAGIRDKTATRCLSLEKKARKEKEKERRERREELACRDHGRCCPRHGPSIHVHCDHLRNLTA
ncbi:unnamed protein product [Lasius platythorax]